MSSPIQSIIALACRRPLSQAETQNAFSIIMNGDATSAQTAGLLMAIHTRGETIDEIAGAALAMRKHMKPINAPKNAVDICGAGGDKKGSLNISTAASFIVAACGVPVAKHGNRAASSQCGAADVLEALGVKLQLPTDALQQCLLQTNLAFLFAPDHHPAMRHVAPTRRELGVPSIFNLLGPLASPASVSQQLVGVPNPDVLHNVASAFQILGAKRVWVVHGQGFDEIAVQGETLVVELRNNKLSSFKISPADADLPDADPNDLIGADPPYNADALTQLLNGTPSAFRNAAVLNAAAALVIADAENDMPAAAKRAQHAVDSGNAKSLANSFIALTQSLAAKAPS